MTEHSTSPRIDPRFDPRFQRGYAPDAAAPVSAPDAAAPAPGPTGRDTRFDPAAPVSGFGDSADTPQASGATRGEAGASPNPATHGAGVAGSATPRDTRFDPAAPVSGFGDSVDTPAASVATRGEAGASPNPATPGAGVTRAVPDAALPDVAADAAPALAAEPVPRTSATRWFWIALGVCAAFVIVGATVYWTQASDPAYFMGGQPGDQTMQQFVMALTPALVQAGVFGIAVVLVAWAIRGRRDSEDAHEVGRQ